MANARKGDYFINVDLEDLNAFDDELAKCTRNHPNDYLPKFEESLAQLYRNFNPDLKDLETLPDFQLQLSSSERPKMLREISSNQISQLIVVPGIITSVTKPQVKATKLVLRCKNCGEPYDSKIGQGLNGAYMPRTCPRAQAEKCPMDPFEVSTPECKFINVQRMRLQENPEQIPTGEIPRTYLIATDRYLVDKVYAGCRVNIIGILSVMSTKDTVGGKSDGQAKTAYIRAIGIQRDHAAGGRLGNLLSSADESAILKLAKDPEIRKKITSSIASAIYGSENIKEAIACLLFGGSPKLLPDKTKLRGDINVLLLGDPSTAKSQFLKFVERASPISVYTSGKGSSAAGLTATIVKDSMSGEFQLEGGAMVLADGGVVCIDEFDKMRLQDRVAIHEAMEQQTISVAKAGITTILNSRTSVLAAANPVFGRYDDLKTAAEQIDFQSTILSRFDCIFLVKDARDEALDRKIAEHVIGLHIGTVASEELQGEIPLEILRKYVTYARAKCFPRLTESAGSALESFYVNDRKQTTDEAKIHGKEGKSIPITVRQLEAIIRLSESLAKMELSSIVTEEHVNEAHRIFHLSTMHAATSGLEMNMQPPEELKGLIVKIEEALQTRLSIGETMLRTKLQDDMNKRFDNERAVAYAIRNKIMREEFEQKNDGKFLKRKK